MANVIVGIHGMANKPPEIVLSEWWRDSIMEGLRKNEGWQGTSIDFEMVHWAPVLHPDPQVPNRMDEPYIEARPGGLKEHRDGWMDTVRQHTTDALGRFIYWLVRTLRLDFLIDRLRRSRAADVDRYYDPNDLIDDGSGTRRPVRDVLMGMLTEAIESREGDRIMLIAHSMGSIVAYDVLRALGKRRPDFEVAHLVTIGSPLGLFEVKRNVRTLPTGTDSSVRTPTVVSECWSNYADRGDVVAIDTHLGREYGPNGRGVRVGDDLVHNDYVGKDGKRNRHKSYGYLRTPEMSRHIAAFLSG